MSKSQEKKSTFFSKIFSTKSPFLKKILIFRKHIGLFSDSGGSSRHFDYLFTCLGLLNNKAIYESTISNIVLNSRKITKIM